MFSGLGIILTVIILCILWPIPFAYAIYKLTNNSKITLISTLFAIAAVLICNYFYPLYTTTYVGILSLGSALFIWMYQEAS
jgi:hypothetical protein